MYKTRITNLDEPKQRLQNG